MHDWWNKPRPVSVVVDTPGWFDPFAERLAAEARARGDDAQFVRDARDVQEGGVAFLLSCLKIVPADVLARNPHNIVVHASALPMGRGFSPVVWQILEGVNEIPVTMIFAAEEVDAGDIVMQRTLSLGGHELNDEVRDRLGTLIVDMCLEYLALPEPPTGTPQQGESSWYRRRRADDSRLDPGKTLAEQFDLLRVVDNERYPAFFDHRGHRYVLKIERRD
jgi:methionyl-tRNA formyltransferase